MKEGLGAIILAATEFGAMGDDYFEGKTRHLLPFGEKSLIQYQVECLHNIGIRDITIVIDEKIKNYKNFSACLDLYKGMVENYRDIHIEIIGQNNLTNVGTLEAVRLCFKKRSFDGIGFYLILFGDCFIKQPLIEEICSHYNKEDSSPKVIWGLIKHESGSRGDVIVNRSGKESAENIILQDQILNILENNVEKPPRYEVFLDTGIMLISEKSWKNIEQLIDVIHRPSSSGIFSFTNIFKQALCFRESKLSNIGNIDLGIKGIVLDPDSWFAANMPWELINLNKRILCDIVESHKKDENAELIGEDGILSNGVTYVYPGRTYYYKDSKIKGPCIIGRDVDISGFSYIENSIVGDKSKICSNSSVIGSNIQDDVQIHSGAVVKDCIVMNNSIIFCNCLLIKSIIGKYAMIGANAVIPCRRLMEIKDNKLNKKDVIFFSDIGIEKIDQFGAIVGDYCQIGAGTIIHPGRRIGKRCTIGANLQIFNNLGPNSNFAEKSM